MKPTIPFTLLALVAGASSISAGEEAVAHTSAVEMQNEAATSWDHLQETLNTLNTTRGKEAPSLEMTFVVGKNMHKVELKPSELMSVMAVTDEAAIGNWEAVASQAQGATIRHLLPAAAMMRNAHEVASRTPAVSMEEWSEGLSDSLAYERLSDLVMGQVMVAVQKGRFYLPSVLVTADPEMSDAMRMVEDSLFESWNIEEEVIEDLVSTETSSRLLRSLGRYPRGNREIFNHFLSSIAVEKGETLWNTFDSASKEIAQVQAEGVRQEIVRSAYLALEKARQNSERPQNLFVEVFSSENSDRNRVKVNEPVGIRYSYDIGSDVPHTVWLSIRDMDDTILYEKTLSDVKLEGSHEEAEITLPALTFAGNFHAQVTIRNEQGHFSDSTDNFRVVERFTVADQARFDMLEELFGAATAEANRLVENLQNLTTNYDALHPELLAAAEEVGMASDEITADNMANTPDENIAKWIESELATSSLYSSTSPSYSS